MSEAVDTYSESKKKDGIGGFVQKTREELTRTTFPGSEEVRNTTIIVIISVIFFGVYLWLADEAWIYILEAISWVINKIAGI